MRVLMTGGAGYVGSACLRWMLARGHEAFAFDDLSSGNAAAVPGDRLIVGDIGDRGALERALEETGAEAVMHFAALASVPESIAEPERYWRVNVLGTKNVLDAMVAKGVERLIFSSTAATFDFDSEMPLTEASAVGPQVPYGTTKLAGEQLIADYARAHRLGYAVLRYFNASGADADGEYGEDRRHESHLIPLVLAAAAGRRSLKVFGDDWPTPDGSCVRDYVHTEDLAQAHQLALERLEPGVAGLYVVGSGEGSSVLEVVRACERAVGKAIAYEVAPRRPGDPAVLVASSARLREELGWAPRYTSIDAIVGTAWQWVQKHPEGYAGK